MILWELSSQSNTADTTPDMFASTGWSPVLAPPRLVQDTWRFPPPTGSALLSFLLGGFNLGFLKRLRRLKRSPPGFDPMYVAQVEAKPRCTHYQGLPDPDLLCAPLGGIRSRESNHKGSTPSVHNPTTF